LEQSYTQEAFTTSDLLYCHCFYGCVLGGGVPVYLMKLSQERAEQHRKGLSRPRLRQTSPQADWKGRQNVKPLCEQRELAAKILSLGVLVTLQNLQLPRSEVNSHKTQDSGCGRGPSLYLHP
jgi:hypothetical protein